MFHDFEQSEKFRKQSTYIVHLPQYSPKFNPIEQVWKTIKNELYY
ncbi:MAG: transposase [Methanobrevibacter sp.]|nr:transposase [Candidatus Methanovirga australis]